MERYLSFHAWAKKTFGRKVYRLSLATGFGCPNRDGTVGRGGCSFCAEGSGAFCAPGALPMEEQLALARLAVAKKTKNAPPMGYVAYFQSYTNTHGPLEVQERLFTQALEVSDVVALGVATRPDCLPEPVLALLERLNRKKPVWVELGLQTANDRTARALNRGYPTQVYVKACQELSARGIGVVTHLILGLKGEGPEDLRRSVELAGSLSQGVKLQQLQILQGTPLAQDPWPTLSLEEYLPLLADCLRRLPPDRVIHRLWGDPDRSRLIAPGWSRDKKRVMGQVQAYLDTHNVIQGADYDPQ